jgi:hypothetical protein
MLQVVRCFISSHTGDVLSSLSVLVLWCWCTVAWLVDMLLCIMRYC